MIGNLVNQHRFPAQAFGGYRSSQNLHRNIAAEVSGTGTVAHARRDHQLVMGRPTGGVTS